MTERADVQAAARVVIHGGIVAYPTEACYGLGCDPGRSAAVVRILRLKHRSYRHGLILIASNVKQLLPYIDPAASAPLARAASSWPGPYTWLVPAHRRVSRWLRGEHDKIAVRVTAHPLAAALCRHSGRALVSTSANRHGRPPARTAAAVRRQFGGLVDLVLVGRLGGQGQPTRITDAVTNEVIRPAT